MNTHRPVRARRLLTATALSVMIGLSAPAQNALASGADDASSPTAVETATAPPQTILDGWISFAPGEGWTVTEQALELTSHRRNVDEPIAEPRYYQTLLHLERGGSEIRLVRELAFLDVVDETTWRDALATLYVGPVAPDRVDTAPAAHGPITRAFYVTAQGTQLVASTRFDDQYLAIVATFPDGLPDAEFAAAAATLESIVLSPEFSVPALLQFHGGVAWSDRAGVRDAELDFDVPSTWVAAPQAAAQMAPVPAVVFRSADGMATFDVTFTEDDGSSHLDRLAALIERRLDAGTTVQNVIEVDISGISFTMAAVNNSGSGAPPSEMAAVLIGDAGSTDVAIVLHSGTASPDDGRLFAAMIDRMVLRVGETP